MKQYLRVRIEEGKLYLFVAIDRTGKFAYAELLPRDGKIEAALVSAQSYRYRTLQNPYHPDRQRHPVHSSQNRQVCLLT